MNLRKLCLLLIAVFIAALLTACTPTVGTTMTLSESFSGQRDIVCSLSGNLANSQESMLEDIIANHCPDELTPVIGETGGKKTATFTLTFSSEEEYVQKLEALLNRKPLVSLRRTQTIFCQGITYSEDFSSRDLLTWFEKAAVESGLAKEGAALWRLEKPRLTFGGKTYTSSSDRLEIADTISYPVEKVTINTLLKQDGQFDRTITIYIPKRTVDALGAQLTAYLHGLVPGGTLKDSRTGKEFIVQIYAASADVLNAQTAAILDSEHSRSQLETDSGATTQFIDQNVFTETLDFASYYNQNGKVYVNYLFSAESPYDVVGAKIMSEGAWVDAPGFDPTVGYIQQGEVSGVDVQLTFRKQIALTDVLLYTEKTDSDQYLRTVTLQFDPVKGLEGPQTMQSYLHERGIGNTTLATDNDGNNTVTVTIRGSIQDIGSAMATLFGEGNSLSHTTAGGFFAFVQTVNWTETVDMGAFLQEAGYTGTVKYTLSPSFDKLKEASIQTGEGEPVTERIDGEFNTSFEPNTAVRLTFSGSQTNMALLIFTGVLTLLIIVVLIVLLSKWMRKSGKGERRSLSSGQDTLLPTESDSNGSYPSGTETQTVEIPVLYADVDADAVTETILLEEEHKREATAKVKKHRKKDQYANAKQILAGINAFGDGPKERSVKQHLQEEKKRRQMEAEWPVNSNREPEAEPIPPAAPRALCEHCEKPLRRDALFCTFCGTRVTREAVPAQRKCSVCGSMVNEQYTFCSKCGTKMD